MATLEERISAVEALIGTEERVHDALRLAALVMSEQEFVTNALWSFARHMDEWEQKTREGQAGPLVDSVGARRAASMFAENAGKARRLASAIAELAGADEDEDEGGDEDDLCMCGVVHPQGRHA